VREWLNLFVFAGRIIASDVGRLSLLQDIFTNITVNVIFCLLWSST
jgi:hypothetical protein